MKTKKEETMEILTCAYCELPATHGVNSVEGDEYYGVCVEDQTRLINDHTMVAVEFIPMSANYWEDCTCGCNEY